MNEVLNKKILDSLILSPIFWAFTGLFLYPGGNKFIVVLVLIATISSLYLYGYKTFINNLRANKWLWLLGTCSLFAVISRLSYGYSSSQLRAILVVLVYLIIFPPILIAKINLKKLTLVGSFVSILFVATQVVIYQNGRNWDINPIPYATFIASISILSLHFLLETQSKKGIILWLATFMVSLIPLFYSQSRGLWLALTITILLLLIKKICTKKIKISFLIILISTISISIFISSDKIDERINITKVEINAIKNGDLNSSIGIRFQLWEAAIILIKDSPLIGQGNDQKKYLELLANKNLISKSIINYNHFHNQFLDIQVRYGLIGLILFLASIILPSYYLLKSNNEYKWPLLLIINIFIIASLTDVPFNNGSTLTFYLLITYIILFKVNIEENLINN